MCSPSVHQAGAASATGSTIASPQDVFRLDCIPVAGRAGVTADAGHSKAGAGGSTAGTAEQVQQQERLALALAAHASLQDHGVQQLQGQAMAQIGRSVSSIHPLR